MINQENSNQPDHRTFIDPIANITLSLGKNGIQILFKPNFLR